MRILITGASGFIGSRVMLALQQRGHEVTGLCFRSHAETATRNLQQVDFANLTSPEAWTPYLTSIDVVVNSAGIIAERKEQSFTAIHKDAPVALFDACVKAGVKKIIQLSAWGADENAHNPFLTSKKAADDYLTGLPIASAIILPSIVYGPGEVSMGWFKSLAVLPLLPLVNGGRTLVYPVHVDDLAAIIAEQAEQLSPDDGSRRLPVRGPDSYNFRQLLSLLRAWMGYRPPLFCNIPDWLSRLLGRLGDVSASRQLNSGAITMLQRADFNHPVPVSAIGTAVRPFGRHLANNPAQAQDRIGAWRFWLNPLLRISFAVLWIGSAYVSVFIFPHAASFSWLREIGVAEELHAATLYLASGLDAGLGLALLLRFQVRTILVLQILLMLCYSTIITLYLPSFWAHPFASVLKNLPLLAATCALIILEDRS